MSTTADIQECSRSFFLHDTKNPSEMSRPSNSINVRSISELPLESDAQKAVTATIIDSVLEQKVAGAPLAEALRAGINPNDLCTYEILNSYHHFMHAFRNILESHGIPCPETATSGNQIGCRIIHTLWRGVLRNNALTVYDMT